MNRAGTIVGCRSVNEDQMRRCIQAVTNMFEASGCLVICQEPACPGGAE